MWKLIPAFLLFASAAFPGDLFSFGIKGGVPFTDAFHAATNADLTYVSHSNDWTFGPEVEIHLPFGRSNRHRISPPVR